MVTYDLPCIADHWNITYKQFFVTETGEWGSYWDDTIIAPFICQKKLSTGMLFLTNKLNVIIKKIVVNIER